MFVSASAVTMTSCTVLDNFATFGGGGFYISTGSNVIVVSSIISNNTALAV